MLPGRRLQRFTWAHSSFHECVTPFVGYQGVHILELRGHARDMQILEKVRTENYRADRSSLFRRLQRPLHPHWVHLGTIGVFGVGGVSHLASIHHVSYCQYIWECERTMDATYMYIYIYTYIM